jgi:transcription elongation factor GreA
LSNFIYLSQEKLIELEKELKELKTEGRDQMAQRIAEARSYGDLSENAEYDAAKEAQGHLELKISKMEKLLAKAKIVDTSKLPGDEIHILSTAEVKNLKNGKVYKYTLVAEEEANLQEGKIAISSPVGGALMGAKKGDIVDAKVPAGIIQFEVLNIE